MGVVEQVRVACRPKNRLATFLGAILGGGAPIASYQLAHHEILSSLPLYVQPAAWLVLGGLVFSALSVYGWANRAFASAVKAAGYCVLLEGTLICSTTPWLSVGALIVLVCVNAVAAGCRLSTQEG